jgi:hypothetical protein
MTKDCGATLLRLATPLDANAGATVLQQLWKGSTEEQWRDVPVKVVFSPGPFLRK